MRLALADVKKAITHRAGEVYVVPRLLRPREHVQALATLIALYEEYAGQQRATFPADRPAEVIGDYRLARCLTTTLGEWYAWESPPWPGPASPSEAEALAAASIALPGDLRLALYDAANARGRGYLPSAEREAALNDFAAMLRISRPTLDALLVLDREERAVLRRIAPLLPMPAQLATRYNQLAVEALLAAAATVEWTLPAPRNDHGALSAALKRVCFLARRMGVHYDVAFEEADHGTHVLVAEESAPYATSASGGLPARALHLTLYGPQEVMGAANQYGVRLARLCRALLGYRQVAGSATLGAEGVRGQARVYLHGRPLTFPLDDSLLALLEDGSTGASEATSEQFDSTLEERLFAEFVALERASESHGWRIEREPEPVIAGETIYLPDFALTRGQRRVFLELASYWRPDYRERKVRKLLALRGRLPLVVAVPSAAREAFAALEGAYPLLFYGAHPSVTALLGLLDREYDDTAARLALVNWRDLLDRVDAVGRLAPAAAMERLGVYSRAELLAALARLAVVADATGRPAPLWLTSVGLCTPAWCEAAQARLCATIDCAPDGRMTLAALREQVARAEPALADLDQDAVEALALRAGLGIQRDSIFEPEVLAPGSAISSGPDAQRQQRPVPPRGPSRRARKPQPMPRASRKVHDVSHMPQSLFAESEPGGAGKDAPEATEK
jgi:predicted nuclease of restriction endonuclease-like RecB superfamily